MDDLKGLDWNSKGPAPNSASPAFPTLRPTPSPSISGRSTPNNVLQAFSPPSSKPSIKVASKPGTPSNDSFASLLSGPAKTTNTLSLQERQRLVQEEKARKAVEEQKRFDAHFRVGNGALGGLNATTNGAQSAKSFQSSRNEDILARFDASASIKTATSISPSATSNQDESNMEFGDDDDPFGLNEFKAKQSAAQQNGPPKTSNDDDDILGMLGRPADEVAAMMKPKDEPKPEPELSDEDKAISQLVDMGFTPDQAAIALASTESGTDVQGAIAILLNQAHDTSRKKRMNEERPQVSRETNDFPAWMKAERSSSQNRGQPSKEKDVAQLASDLGTTLFKSANSLWKTGQRKVQQAVADFTEPVDSNQPKWMRETKEEKPNPFRNTRPEITDEALMLEGRRSPPTRPVQSLPSRPPKIERNLSPKLPERRPHIEAMQAHRLTRQELETTEPEAYISPARRRKPHTEQPAPVRKSPLASNNPFATIHSPRSITPAQSRSSTPVRPKAPPRKIPPASDSALATSASFRQNGSDAYKRGDYGAANEAYTRALQPLPSSHPVAIVVFCNRALTNIKVGEPKAAVADADSALEIIGPSRGEGEKIRLGVAEGEKDMKEFYGKALLRKAEALENMEKWTEAVVVWKLAVESGVGGSVAIQGRDRCERAAAPKSARPAPKPKPKPKPARSAMDDLRPSVGHTASNEAVRKLREANAAAQKADDEKFALTDAVDAKLVMWKGTKADNLRALLGSLDKVLWDGAGWNKVGMQDLVLPNRVKIIYMKAIAKVHPDKIPQDANMEQRMISAAVFATLNEAWDKFKAENGL